MAEIFCFTRGYRRSWERKETWRLYPQQLEAIWTMWCKKSFLMWRLLLDLGRPTGADTTINANHIPARTADQKIIKKKGKTEQNQNKFLFVYIYWEACYYKVVKSYRRLYDGAKGICKIQATLRSYIFVIFQQIRFNLGIFTKWFWQTFANFSLSKAEKAMKGFILSKIFFWAFVHF